MSIILLMGLKASGKTTIGRHLAKSLSLKFIDLDEIISKETSMPFRLFYEKYGKKAFQEIEAKVLKNCLEMASYEDTIISTGGGLIENTNACLILQKASNIQIFFLHNKPKILFNRVLKKAKKEHSMPAFLKLPSIKSNINLATQFRYAKVQFLLMCKRRMPLLKKIDCMKVKTKGLNVKKVVKLIKKAI
ncbi:MAG: shikimate kinase [Treponema sp.]